MTLLAKIWLWVISVVLSMVLWLAVQIVQEDVEAEVDMQVKLIDPPSNLVLTSFEGTSSDGKDLHVTVKYSGPQNLIEEFKNKRLEASVDCRHVGPGKPKLDLILPSLSMHYSGLKHEKKKVTLTFEQLVTASKEVEVDINGDFNLKNFIYDSSTVEPDRVSYRGPKSQVAKVVHARVLLDLSTIVKNETVRLPIELLDATSAPVDGVVPLFSNVDVHPSLVPAPQNKMLLVTVTPIGDQPPPGYMVKEYHVTPSQVSAVGESEALARTTTIETLPLSFRNITSNDAVRIKLKPLRGIKVQPDSVVVHITVARTPVQPTTPSPTRRPIGPDTQDPLPIR